MIGETELCPWLPQALSEADGLMLECINDVPGMYRDSLTEILTKGGKRLRPALVLVCGRMGAPDEKKLLNLAAGIELLHVATLVHDDIIDGASTRRGVPSLNRIFDSKQAVIAGDFLLAKSLSLLHSALPETRTGEFLGGLLQICRSELLQNSSRHTVSLSIRHYLRRIAGKTAALFMLSCQAGAAAGEMDTADQYILRRYAYNLGLAFQVIDDVLDLEAGSSVLKKPAAQDLKMGILTLPALLALNEHPEKVAAVKQGNRVSVKRTLRLIEYSDSLSKAREWARRFSARGRKELDKLPHSNEQRYLSRLLDTLINRSH